MDRAETLKPLVLGVAIAAFVSIAMGLWIGLCAGAEWLFSPIFIVMQSAPLAALIPILVMAYGIGLTSKVVLDLVGVALGNCRPAGTYVLLAASVRGLCDLVFNHRHTRRGQGVVRDGLRLFDGYLLCRYDRHSDRNSNGQKPPSGQIAASVGEHLPQRAFDGIGAVKGAIIGQLLISIVGFGALFKLYSTNFLMAHFWVILVLLFALAFSISEFLGYLERKVSYYAASR